MYLRFQNKDGTIESFLRGHLRWIELADDQSLKLGFSGNMVIITGRNLSQLAAFILCGTRKTVTQTEERHQPESDIWVKAIMIQPHEHS
jgi:hypothetical protein